MALLEMFGYFIEQALEGKLNKHLGYSRYDFQHQSILSSRNWCQLITIKTSRDYEQSVQPQIVRKRNTNVIRIEDKMLAPLR